MSAKTIFIVQGSTGEYSDHCEWPVAAFYSEEKAKALVVDATRRANEIFAKGNYYDNTEVNEFDPGMQTDYTGTRYCHFPVEIKDDPQIL